MGAAQTFCPAGQLNEYRQIPFVQVSFVPQTRPQEPQFWLSVWRDATQYGPLWFTHVDWPVGHVNWQTPFVHVSFVPQTRPQVPQFRSSVWSDAQYGPGVPATAQTVCPGSQVSSQRPDKQTRPEGQASPHAPQFRLSVSSAAQ